MRAIIVDDEQFMLKRFVRLSASIPDLNIVGQFENAADCLAFIEHNTVEVAFLDIEMPMMDGLQLAEKLREIRKDILIIFVSAHNDYLWDANQVGGDFYIMKPYSIDTLEMAMERIRLIARRQMKELYIQLFGRFLVLKDGKPLPLSGKAKEILALVVTKRGREISNESIYSTIWENREYSNYNMSVYYNALRRLKRALSKAGYENLLISAPHGQKINTDLFDCDYYEWLDGKINAENSLIDDFLSEYSWAEAILATLIKREDD